MRCKRQHEWSDTFETRLVFPYLNRTATLPRVEESTCTAGAGSALFIEKQVEDNTIHKSGDGIIKISIRWHVSWVLASKL